MVGALWDLELHVSLHRVLHALQENLPSSPIVVLFLIVNDVGRSFRVIHR